MSEKLFAECPQCYTEVSLACPDCDRLESELAALKKENERLVAILNEKFGEKLQRIRRGHSVEVTNAMFDDICAAVAYFKFLDEDKQLGARVRELLAKKEGK